MVDGVHGLDADRGSGVRDGMGYGGEETKEEMKVDWGQSTRKRSTVNFDLI